MDHDYAKVERWRRMMEAMRDRWPDASHEELLKPCNEELARLDAILAAAESDPRGAEHFQRVALANVKGSHGCAEDELREALEDDYFWSVEETEAIQKRSMTDDMRQAILYDRDRSRDENG